MTQQARLDYFAAAPDAMKGMLELEKAVKNVSLEPSLVELVKIRASQINGCAYCIYMHTKAAREHGEAEERLYLLDAWRESPLYSDRERAALAWTEALTLISQTHAPDEDYAAFKEHFSDQEQVELTLVISAYNAWNRFAIGFRSTHPAKASRVAA
jgi:AhpD family alkylhydroperoxidase